jgi:predicted transcriptional regulator
MSKPTGGAVSLEQERFDQTLQALADVDVCRVIDHQAVQAWADSLGTETPLPTPYFQYTR